MKILFISCNDWVPWGGSEELWYKTAIELQKSGHEVHINVKKWNPRPGHIQACLDAGCRVFERGFKPSYTIPARLKRLVIADRFDQQQQNEEYLRFLKPDVVIINQGSIFDGMDWAKLCQQHNIPYCPIVQLVNEYMFYGDNEVEQLINVYSMSHRIFFVSKQNERLLHSMLGHSFKNTEIVRNPYREYEGNIQYMDTSQGHYLANVASFNPFHKGQPLLFEVLADNKWQQRELFLNLYGKGIAENTFNRMIKYYDLSSRVKICGFESEIENIWQHNHGLILSSRMEGQSLALIEAMYCERISIVTNVGGADEIIDDGINGFICQSHTVSEIDHTLEKAWQKRSEWKEMGLLARKSLIGKFKEDPIKVFKEKIINLKG